MKRLSKKIITFSAVVVLTMTSLMGCKSIDNSEIVATVGDSKITLGMANFYARYGQPEAENYYTSYQNYQQLMIYGSIVYEGGMDWRAEQEDGMTLEDAYKEDIMTALQNLYIMEDHMGDYGIELTKEEQDTIEKVASDFMKANSDEVKEKLSADKETVVEFLKLTTISHKVDAAIRAEADTEVSDEEAAQKRLRYVSFDISDSSEGLTTGDDKEETKDAKEEASAFLEAAKANGSLEAYATEAEKESETATFGADYADAEEGTLALPKEVYEAADKLEENGFAEIVETDTELYVVQLESTFDEEATAAEKEAIIDERQDKQVEETIEKWREDTKIEVNKKVWAKVSLYDLQVTEKEVETDDTTEDNTENTGEDTTEDDTVDDAADDAATDDTVAE